MTSQEVISRLKAEIERRKQSLRAGICSEDAFTKEQKREMLVAREEIDRFNRILDSLGAEEKENLIMANSPQLKEQKQEWGEKEYGRLFDIEHYLDGTLQLSPDRKIACIDFLKSLRPSWKPSEEQMEALYDSIEWEEERAEDVDFILKSLYNNLKKLM